MLWTVLTVLSAIYLVWSISFTQSLFHHVWSANVLILSGLLFHASQWHSFDYSCEQVITLSTIAIFSAIALYLSPLASLFRNHGRENDGQRDPGDNDLDAFGSLQAASVDIVAVHGLASDVKKTWHWHINEKDGAADPSESPMWLRDFLPNEGLNARVMVWKHNTRWDAYALNKSLPDHAEDLLRALCRYRQTKEAVILPSRARAHEAFSNISQQTLGFIFLGTPHKGSQLATIARLLTLPGFWKGSITRLLDITQRGSTFNSDLHDKFFDFLLESCGLSNTLCVYESVKVSVCGFPISEVVDKDSATITGAQKIGFDKSHTELQRFSSRNDGYYQDLVRQMRDWIEKIKRIDSGPRTQKTEQEQGCLQSLAFKDMELRGNEIREQLPETCNWLFQHQLYTSWLAQQRSLLWLSGKPGAGKSTLLKCALRRARAKLVGKTTSVVASFFFDGKGSYIQNSRLGMFRSLLHQISAQIPSTLAEITALYEEKCQVVGEYGSKWEWHEAELQEILYNSLSKGEHRVQIYVDAVDEGGEKAASLVVEFFESLISKTPAPASALQICFSCRHYPILILGKSLTVCLENENEKDIVTYVQRKMSSKIKQDHRARLLEKAILRKASGVFQWVVLVVERLLKLEKGGSNTEALLKQIEKTPAELDSLYEKILKDLDREGVAQILKLMQWIYCAAKPLSLRELRYAMAMDLACPTSTLAELEESPDFMENDEDMEKRVKSLSGGLIEIKGKRLAQFGHQSINDYMRHSGLQTLHTQLREPCTSPINCAGNALGCAFFQVSRMCIRYLTAEEVLNKVSSTSTNLKSRKLNNEFPFFRHAAVHWPKYAQNVEASGILQADLIDLFQWPSKAIWVSFEPLRSSYRPNLLKRSTLLYAAIAYGLASTVEAIMQSQDFDVNESVRSLRSELETPLSAALKTGHLNIAKMLLSHDNIEPNKTDEGGQTPLNHASRSGYTGIVKELLARGDVHPDVVNSRCSTPLQDAAQYGHVAICRLLLDWKVTMLNLVDFFGRTPLHEAAESGHMEVVGMFLKYGHVEADRSDSINGATPLRYAARNGHVPVMRTLLQRTDVDPNAKDCRGRTPLICAVTKRRSEAAKLLTTQPNVNVNHMNDWGYTALSVASKFGDLKMVELLLRHDRVNVDAGDIIGRTPFFYACCEGMLPVMKALLATGQVNVNEQDKWGLYPLARAILRRRTKVVEFLLSREDVRKDLRDSFGKEPLAFAVRPWGQPAIVKALLARDDVDRDARDTNQRTPLALAASNYASSQIMELLVAHNDIDRNARDVNGRTPLALASRKICNINVVEVLLNDESVDKNMADNQGLSPLSLAIRRRRFERLYTRSSNDGPGDPGPEEEPLTDEEPMSDEESTSDKESTSDEGSASETESGSESESDSWPDERVEEPASEEELKSMGRLDLAIVERLLRHPKVNVNAQDCKGRSPLAIAAIYSCRTVFELLVTQDDVDVNAVDHAGRSPLALAIIRNRQFVVEILLARRGVHKNSRDSRGRTPLSLAIARGYEHIVRLLLAQDDVDKEAKDNLGRTPLAIAAAYDQKEIYNLLLSFNELGENTRDKEGQTPSQSFAAITCVHNDKGQLSRINGRDEGEDSRLGYQDGPSENSDDEDDCDIDEKSLPERLFMKYYRFHQPWMNEGDYPWGFYIAEHSLYTLPHLVFKRPGKTSNVPKEHEANDTSSAPGSGAPETLTKQPHDRQGGDVSDRA